MASGLLFLATCITLLSRVCLGDREFVPPPQLQPAPVGSNTNNPAGGQGLVMPEAGDNVARGNSGTRFAPLIDQRQPAQFHGQGQTRQWVGRNFVQELQRQRRSGNGRPSDPPVPGQRQWGSRGYVTPNPYPAPGPGQAGRPSNRPMRINDNPQCREDVAHLCGKNARGNNFSVLDCLQNARECRNKLTTRQKVASVDAKANYWLFRKCKIKKTKCNRPKDSQNREFRLSKLLICLEEAKHNNIKLSGDCVAELEETRKSLMEDYMINPEIITMCKDEIGNHCSGLERGGKTLHCLMKLTQEKPPKLGQDCEKALQDLVKTADAGANYRIDKALHKACKPVRDKLCKDVEAGDANCKTVLTKRSIQRKEDFRLNPRMQKACRRDMPKFCSDVLDKSKKEEYKEKELEGEMLLCLKKKFPTKSLSPDCENYIRDAIQEASMDIRMDPVLFSGCQDTAKRLCSEELETPGQGLVAECLKTNLYKGKIISLKCRMQVIRLLQECRTDVHIDTLLYKACALDIKHFCAGIPQGEGRQMSCLLEALEDSTVKLHADCQRMLSERKEMWRYAIRESPPNSFPDLAAAINAPKARGHLLTILFLIIGVLGFGGLYCYSSRQKIQH